MSRCIVSFGGRPYDPTTEVMIKNADAIGINDVRVYDDIWWEQQLDFRSVNQWLVDHPHKRGALWYNFKSYCMKHAFKSMNDGDIALWLDADTVPLKPLDVLFDLCEKRDAVFFEVSPEKRQSDWCKRDAFLVTGLDEQKYWDSQPACARFFLLKGPQKVEAWLDEWATYCRNPYATTLDKSVLGTEFPNLKEHRTEQALMGILAIKYGFTPFLREPSQNGNAYSHDRDKYDQLFAQVPCERQYLNVTCPALGSRFFNIDTRSSSR